jgi:stage II sporulation protein D
VGVEEYLAGVVPAEMPHTWPLEALKAQAVAVRSDVAAHLGGGYSMEGFDFWGSEKSHAYFGAGGRKPSTDKAVSETRGKVLLSGIRVIPTVFASNCGGWTESNENIWSSPPDDALRGRSDGASGGVTPASIEKWLRASPAANCSGEGTGYRWTRRLSRAEVTASVNKIAPVGAVRDLIPLERGVSGRLKSLKVVGDGKTEIINKELPIRQALGGLPSAMFVVEKAGSSGFVITGGGRGHGVGLCQYGARGLAGKGVPCSRILEQYFSGSKMGSLH